MTAEGTASTRRQRILQAGRKAAAASRRADSQSCRARVTAVIDDMRRRRTPLGDAEITRRARVNAQYLHRHRDLKIHAEQVRSVLLGDTGRHAAATQSATERAPRTENAMLAEQNTHLRQRLNEVGAELRQLRIDSLAATATGVRSGRVPRDAAVAELQQRLDGTQAVLRAAEADLVAVRNLNQRLLIENSMLIDVQDP
jgi:hypothetical protein